MDININKLIGKTLNSIVVNDDNDEILFATIEGEQYKMFHNQDCCETVDIESIDGDLNDLLGTPIIDAEEVTNGDENPEGVTIPEYQDSWTWTFYKLRTSKGYVTIRWYGESNGYYSEDVGFYKIDQ